jgi:Acetyl-coenzyme A transporter 1
MTVRPDAHITPDVHIYVWQLLNTATNLGGTWPKYFVLRGVDIFTVATCRVKDGTDLILQGELGC